MIGTGWPLGNAGTIQDRKTDKYNIAVIMVLWFAMTALVNPIGDFPLNDDWIYGGSAKSILDRGYFWIPGPAIPNLFAQAYWGALFCLPFGFSFTALRFSCLTLGLVGVLALYALLRYLGGIPRTALLGALTLAVNPPYFNLANSFMTDVPFVCVTILSIFFIVRGLTEQSGTQTLAGVAAAFVAILIRQIGIFILLGFAVAYPIRNGFRAATLLKGIVPAVMGVVLHLVFQRWVIDTGRAPDVVLGSVHELIPDSFTDLAMNSLRQSIYVVPYMGAFLLPLLIMSGRSRLAGITSVQERSPRIILACLSTLFLVVFVWKHAAIRWWHAAIPMLDNVITRSGVGALTLRDVYLLHINEPVIPPVMENLWLVVTALGVVGAFLLLDRIVRAGVQAWSAFRNNGACRVAWLYPMAMVAAGTYWAAMLALIYWDGVLFDRYLLFVLPLMMIVIVIAHRPDVRIGMTRARALLSVSLVVVYGAFSVAATHDYVAWNRSRWSVLRHLIVEEKVAPNRIDGGYEFNGWVQHDPKYEPKADPVYWKLADPEYIVSFGPIVGYREVGRHPIDRWLPSTKAEIFVLQKTVDSP
jgi:hypothetical protein